MLQNSTLVLVYTSWGARLERKTLLIEAERAMKAQEKNFSGQVSDLQGKPGAMICEDGAHSNPASEAPSIV